MVQLEIMFSNKGTLAKPVCKFTPFPPTKVAPEGGNTRTTHEGLTGTMINVSVVSGGSQMIRGPCWISDEELDRIEVRNDWKFHFYSLLLDYELAD